MRAKTSITGRAPRRLSVLALLLLAALLGACGSAAAPPAPTTKPTAPPAALEYPHEVKYRVTGSARQADIIYVAYTQTEGVAKHARVTLPWTRSFGAMEGEYVYVSGQNLANRGSVSCEIILDGKPLKKVAAPVRGSVASCNSVLGKD